MNSDTVVLYCLLKDQPLHNCFEVEVCRDQEVGDLRELVKETNKPALDRINAITIELYKVSIPSNDNTALQEAYNQLENQEPLDPMDTIGEVFPSPIKRHIHLIVKIPGYHDGTLLLAPFLSCSHPPQPPLCHPSNLSPISY
jgi:Crinkler effector protein N-terminal domain